MIFQRERQRERERERERESNPSVFNTKKSARSVTGISG
jgi:hypothetical protein